MFDTTEQENILVIGQSGSGKSTAISELIQHYNFLQKKILVIGYSLENIDYNLTTIKSIFYKWGQRHRIGEEELSRSFSQETFDIVVVDEIHLLSELAKNKLFKLILDRPGIKFVIAAQSWPEEYRDKRKHFGKAFVGKISMSDVCTLSPNLKIDLETLEACSRIENHSFLGFDLQTLVLK